MPRKLSGNWHSVWLVLLIGAESQNEYCRRVASMLIAGKSSWILLCGIFEAEREGEITPELYPASLILKTDQELFMIVKDVKDYWNNNLNKPCRMHKIFEGIWNQHAITPFSIGFQDEMKMIAAKLLVLCMAFCLLTPISEARRPQLPRWLRSYSPEQIKTIRWVTLHPDLL